MLGQAGQLLHARYQRSLEALEAAASAMRWAAIAADEAAKLAELQYARKKAADQDRRNRDAVVQLQRLQQQQRDAERQQQQQQQQKDGEGGTEMRDLGASASSSQADSEDTVRGELM